MIPITVAVPSVACKPLCHPLEAAVATSLFRAIPLSPTSLLSFDTLSFSFCFDFLLRGYGLAHSLEIGPVFDIVSLELYMSSERGNA